MKDDYRNLLPNCVEYPFPLRANGNICFWLPRDLSITEARRLAAFLESLVDVNATVGFIPAGAISEDQTPNG